MTGPNVCIEVSGTDPPCKARGSLLSPMKGPQSSVNPVAAKRDLSAASLGAFLTSTHACHRRSKVSWIQFFPAESVEEVPENGPDVRQPISDSERSSFELWHQEGASDNGEAGTEPSFN